MILDTLDHLARYESLNPHFKAAFDFIRRTDLATLPIGKTPIIGDALFVNANDYATKPLAGAELEAHRRYIDLQLITRGQELIGWAPLANNLTCVSPYDTKKDIAFYTGKSPYLPLVPGQFVIFFPSDAHAPGCTAGAPESVRKIVFKIQA